MTYSLETFIIILETFYYNYCLIVGMIWVPSLSLLGVVYCDNLGECPVSKVETTFSDLLIVEM